MTDKNDMGTEKEQEINGTPENCGEEKTETAPETETESDKTLTQNAEEMDAMDEPRLREYEILIKEQAELKKQIEKGNSYLDMLAALKSDFENYRRRTNAQAENSEKEGRLFVIKKLLPVLDTFDRAREMLDEVTMTTFNLIVRQFDKVLADCGVEVIDVLGQPFDPATANAVHSLETDKEEEKNVVLEVYANGYRYGDKVLRYAQVCVGV